MLSEVRTAVPPCRDAILTTVAPDEHVFIMINASDCT